MYSESDGIREKNVGRVKQGLFTECQLLKCPVCVNKTVGDLGDILLMIPCICSLGLCIGSCLV